MNMLFSAIVALTNLCGTVSVDTLGARVLSYVPSGKSEVFFVSGSGTGGMPLCWPWFAGLGPRLGSRRHGLARYHDFRVLRNVQLSPRESVLELGLASDSETRREFPYDFSLVVSVRLADKLTVSMTGENVGDRPFKVTEALHPYFAVADQRECKVAETGDGMRRLVDPVGKRTLSLAQSGGHGYHIWRPGPESHLSKSVSPIGPDDWRKFICVESGTFKKADAYILGPGESHTLTCTIGCSAP